jgi:hypothetical protein
MRNFLLNILRHTHGAAFLHIQFNKLFDQNKLQYWDETLQIQQLYAIIARKSRPTGGRFCEIIRFKENHPGVTTPI